MLNPTIQADIRDYQHYKSGERIDGMFGAVALIGSFVTMATSSVLPAVYEKYGIYSGNGYENMYDVLYDLPTLYRLIGVLVILSVVGAALNVIPYFFYDLTETKQKAIIKILQIRAMFEDYGNGVLTDDDMMSTMELIRKSKDTVHQGKIDVKALKQSKADKKAIKAAAEQYEISAAIIEELERFTTKQSAERLKWAKSIVSRGIGGISDISDSSVAEARALLNGSKEERAIRRQAIADAKLCVRSRKAADKYYPNGITAFDDKQLNDLYALETSLAEKKSALLKSKADKLSIKKISDEQKDVAKKSRF